MTKLQELEKAIHMAYRTQQSYRIMNLLYTDWCKITDKPFPAPPSDFLRFCFELQLPNKRVPDIDDVLAGIDTCKAFHLSHETSVSFPTPDIFIMTSYCPICKKYHTRHTHTITDEEYREKLR